ncbi:MAG: biopolymer transporter ExbD [bacterium]
MAKRERRQVESTELNMTAMIDVVFQLLIYFIVTTHPQDVMAHLDVFRPSADPQAQKDAPPPRMIRIAVLPTEFYTMNDKLVSLADLEFLLMKLASIDPTQTIMIMCYSQSRHSELVRVLDICAKSGMKNLSVVSMN